jgi:uncharacterized membrane protein
VALGTVLCAASVQSMLGSAGARSALASRGLMERIDRALGSTGVAEPANSANSGEAPEPPFVPILLVLAGVSLLAWLGGAAVIGRRQGIPFAQAAAKWGLQGWVWWLVGGSWELLQVLAFSAGTEGTLEFLSGASSFWIAAGVAGWVATFLSLASTKSAADDSQPETSFRDNYHVPLAVWLCFAAYVIAFTVMNWQLYRGLRLPHGDSAMYEEHLWNLLHGKGFRSYLDQGLFLGEHVQVIHLLLIPLYLLWPSQMLLELCDSVLLAATCIPVYWIARRHSGQSQAAIWLAAACLLYFPLQFLDIAIDLKTFRPNGLGIPVLLFALDQLERRRYRTFCLLAALALSAQEDFAIVLAPLGIWIALAFRTSNSTAQEKQPAGESRTSLGRRFAFDRRKLAFGLGLTVFSVVYLIVATQVVMAHFRHGQEIHYASYFKKFGKTLPEIAQNMLTNPLLLWDAFVNGHTAEYALMLLAPLGFLPLLSPGRLAVALPLFLTLCLNEAIKSPLFHAHAAAVPIVLWAAAAGLGTVSRWSFNWRASVDQPTTSGGNAYVRTRWWATFVGVSALVTGAFCGLSPLSISFWDPDSGVYWRQLYVVGKRAELFPRVLKEIPETARVASTDFVHPRFTHFERSYDYSDYLRAVNNYQPGVPPDTDYIVIDTHGPYSKVTSPAQVPEYRDHSDQWALLPDTTDGYFIVLKRKPLGTSPKS